MRYRREHRKPFTAQCEEVLPSYRQYAGYFTVARPATVCALASAVWSDAGRVEVHGAWWTVAVYQFQLSLGADNNNADRDRDRERERRRGRAEIIDVGSESEHTLCRQRAAAEVIAHCHAPVCYSRTCTSLMHSCMYTVSCCKIT